MLFIASDTVQSQIFMAKQFHEFRDWASSNKKFSHGNLEWSTVGMSSPPVIAKFLSQKLTFK